MVRIPLILQATNSKNSCVEFGKIPSFTFTRSKPWNATKNSSSELDRINFIRHFLRNTIGVTIRFFAAANRLAVSRKNPAEQWHGWYYHVRRSFQLSGKKRSRWMVVSGGQRPIRVVGRSVGSPGRQCNQRGLLLLKNGPLCLAVYGGRDLAGLPSADSHQGCRPV